MRATDEFIVKEEEKDLLCRFSFLNKLNKNFRIIEAFKAQ